MLKLFPLIIVSLVVIVAGPVAVEFIGSMVMETTAQTVEMMK